MKSEDADLAVLVAGADPGAEREDAGAQPLPDPDALVAGPERGE